MISNDVSCSDSARCFGQHTQQNNIDIGGGAWHLMTNLALPTIQVHFLIHDDHWVVPTILVHYLFSATLRTKFLFVRWPHFNIELHFFRQPSAQFFFSFCKCPPPPPRWLLVDPFLSYSVCTEKREKMTGFCAHFLFRESTDHNLIEKQLCQCVISVPLLFPGKLWSNFRWAHLYIIYHIW